MHELEGDIALEAAVVGLVDRRHPAARHALADLVARVDDPASQGVVGHDGILWGASARAGPQRRGGLPTWVRPCGRSGGR